MVGDVASYMAAASVPPTFLLIAILDVSVAWDASLDMSGRPGDWRRNNMGQRIQDVQLRWNPDTGSVTAPPMPHVPHTVAPWNSGGGEALNSVEQAANQYNERVLQFCGTVMPQEVCSAAAAKWRHQELSPSHKPRHVRHRALRAVSVNIRACNDAKRLHVQDSTLDVSLALPRAKNVASGALAQGGSENATSIGADDLTLLDLSSAFQSLHGWEVEQVL